MNIFKTIMLFSALLLCGIVNSQPIVNRAGAANTVQDGRLAAQYNLFLPRYADTVSANISRGIDTCGALIFTYDSMKVWYRSCSPKRWVIVGSGSGGGGSGNTLSNVGAGAQLVKTLSGGNYPIRTLVNGFAISATQNTNDITVAVDTTQLRDTLNVINVGVGDSLATVTNSSATNHTIRIGKIQAGSNITTVQNPDGSITINGGAGTSYTFSTGLTLATTTVTNNLATGISGNQTLIGSTSNGSGLNIKATTGTGTSGSDIRFLVGNNGADTALIVKNNKHVLINTAADPGAQLNLVGPVKLLFDNALHVWDMITIDSSLQLKRFPITAGSNGQFVGKQGDTLAWVTGGLTNSNVGSGYRLAIPNTNNIKTLISSDGTITFDSSTSNSINFHGTTITGNGANKFILGSGTPNTLTASSVFSQNSNNEFVMNSGAGDAYMTIKTTGDPTNPSFFYFPNSDIQIYAHNQLNVSINGTANKTYLQTEGSWGAKAFVGNTTDLQMTNAYTEYVYTGTSDKTWFLPTIATANNYRWYIVKNRGSDTLTVADQASASSIYTNTAVVSVIVPPSASYMFISDGTYWTAYKFVDFNIDPTFGTYTPTLTNQTNVSASTAYRCQYSRVGNVITVSGKVDIDPTATGATELRVSLPFTPGFTNDFEAGGTANSGGVAGEEAAISAVASGGTIAIKFIAVDVTNKSYFFSFTYLYTAP